MQTNCLVCNSKDIEILDNPKYEIEVRGDKRLSENTHFKKAICKKCGTIQHLQTNEYKTYVRNVFSTYDALYTRTYGKKHQESRLGRIQRYLKEKIKLNEVGLMLDIGCGSGESFDFFYSFFPKWKMVGVDVGNHFRNQVIIKKNVIDFFDNIDDIIKRDIKFDFIEMNFSLCEVDNPLNICKKVFKILKDDGFFFISETNLAINPFVLNTVEANVFLTKKA